MPPIDQRVAELLRALRERIPRAPAWTEGSEGDPGITLAAVFAYLGEQVGTASTRLPASARAELARLGARLMDLDPAAPATPAAPDVRVDGERWTAVDSLATAAPDATVFAVDRVTGRILFGDGIHGRRPSADATIAIRYRHGGSESGNQPAPAPASTAADFSMVADGDTVERNHYFVGRLLDADDFRLEQQYFNRKLKRLQRAVLKTGIIRGLAVSMGEDGNSSLVTVSPGFALDPHGELIDVPDAITIAVPDCSEPATAWVTLRYVERLTAPVPVLSGPDDTDVRTQPTRVAEGYAVAITPDADADAVQLGRLVHDGQTWRLVPIPRDTWDGDN